MSRIGKKPINIPEGVSLTVKDGQVSVKSSKAELTQDIPRNISVKLKDNQLVVSRKSDSRQVKALHGLTRSLIANMITGVTQGFTKILELHGTGYRVALKDKGVELSLGFSHPVAYQPPPGVTLEVKDKKLITISGFNKQLVGQAAADIRRLRPPDVYKGKGVRYQDEVVRLKPGKAAKTGEGGLET